MPCIHLKHGPVGNLNFPSSIYHAVHTTKHLQWMCLDRDDHRLVSVWKGLDSLPQTTNSNKWHAAKSWVIHAGMWKYWHSPSGWGCSLQWVCAVYKWRGRSMYLSHQVKKLGFTTNFGLEWLEMTQTHYCYIVTVKCGDKLSRHWERFLLIQT